MKADDWSDPILDEPTTQKQAIETIQAIRSSHRDVCDPDVPYYRKVEKVIGVAPYQIAQEYPYNIGTALVYLLRSPYKHGNPREDYVKAIDHIRFELERLKS